MFDFFKVLKLKMDGVIERLDDIVWKLGELEIKHFEKLSEFGLVEEPIMPPEERKNYVADVSVVFEKVLKPKIDKLIFQQKEYIASKGLKEEFEFDRGTMNGILTVFEEFEKDHLEHLDNVKPKEEFDRHELFSELTK
jgi:hypothetical protein